MKKFEELKKGDFIYYYSMDDWKGPSEIGQFQLTEDPINDCYCTQGVVEIAVEIMSPYEKSPDTSLPTVILEFSCSDTEETIDLADYGNIWAYGKEIYKFMTDLERIKESRNDYIQRLISSHESSITSLKKLNGFDFKEEDDIVFIDNEDGNNPFFDVSDDDFKNLVGKCFANHDKTIVLKVTGLRDDYDSPYYEDDYHISNFLYEQFEQDFLGDWCEEDYNWLQDTAEHDPEYKRWCLSKYTNMNIGSEGMYHLAVDGNLYSWVDCDEYYRFHEISQEEFEEIKQSIKS